MIYHDREHENTAIIEEVYTRPYCKAPKKQKAYRVIYTADYDDSFVYRVSVFETLEEAKKDLRICCFEC